MEILLNFVILENFILNTFDYVTHILLFILNHSMTELFKSGDMLARLCIE